MHIQNAYTDINMHICLYKVHTQIVYHQFKNKCYFNYYQTSIHDPVYDLCSSIN